VKFWDISALVPLLVEEDASETLRTVLSEDHVIIVAWTTEVECASAIARAEHDDLLTVEAINDAFARLDELRDVWREVEARADVRLQARRLLRVHRLRAADAIQLASAILAAQHQPVSLPFVTMDDRLELAARREGFAVIHPRR
jgi:predicted nucleic acid-binding protein